MIVIVVSPCELEFFAWENFATYGGRTAVPWIPWYGELSYVGNRWSNRRLPHQKPRQTFLWKCAINDPADR